MVEIEFSEVIDIATQLLERYRKAAQEIEGFDMSIPNFDTRPFIIGKTESMIIHSTFDPRLIELIRETDTAFTKVVNGDDNNPSQYDQIIKAFISDDSDLSPEDKFIKVTGEVARNITRQVFEQTGDLSHMVAMYLAWRFSGSSGFAVIPDGIGSTDIKEGSLFIGELQEKRKSGNKQRKSSCAFPQFSNALFRNWNKAMYDLNLPILTTGNRKRDEIGDDEMTLISFASTMAESLPDKFQEGLFEVLRENGIFR